MYIVVDDAEPEWEWFRPSRDEYKGLNPEMKEHVIRGGLMIRKRKTPLDTSFTACDTHLPNYLQGILPGNHTKYCG
jgi:hypothetical protein